jgi:hypothetical protein
MSLTYEQAVDEIHELWQAAWEETGYDFFYDEIADDRSATNDPFAYFMVRHSLGQQASISGGNGFAMYERRGNAITQIFTPTAKGLPERYQLSKVVSDAFEGKSTPGGVWFRNLRINEIGREGQFFQTNVTVEFLYDETK